MRLELHSARADEWLKKTGARLTSSASRIVATDTWDRSTSMPRRFISLTTVCNTNKAHTS